MVHPDSTIMLGLTKQDTGKPCNKNSNFLPPGTVPQPCVKKPNDWTPYNGCVQFKTANFLYGCNQMSASQIYTLCYLWTATLCKHGDAPPFKDHCHLYKTIDKTPLSDVKWNSFAVKFLGEIPDIPDVPTWMTQ